VTLNQRTVLKTLLKIAVSATLMVIILKKLSVGELKNVLTSIDSNLFLLAGLVYFVSNVLGALQWHLLLGASGIRFPFHRTFRFYFVGLFFNNFLPANIGGDAVKVYDVSRAGGGLYQVVAVTLLDRLLGIFSLCLLASIATVALFRLQPMGSLWLFLLLFLGCMIPAVGFYMFKPLGKKLRKAVLAIRIFSLDRRMTQILDHLGRFKGRKSLVSKLIGLSLVVQALRVYTHILVGMAIGISVSRVAAIQFFVFVPLLSLAMIPPVTINGLGVREGLGILLFALAGLSRTDAFMMEFLTYIVSIVVSFLGWLFFVARKPMVPAPRAEDALQGAHNANTR
jgi:uncharacterized protein (TIRG00374 family)